MKRKRKTPPIMDIDQSRQMVKIMAVILRDHTHLSFHDVVLSLSYCWRFTETEEASLLREARDR